MTMRAFIERERDILNKRWLGAISNQQARKLLDELWADWQESELCKQ